MPLSGREPRAKRQLRIDIELAGRLALGGEVLGLGPAVHELGGEEGDLPPNPFISHREGAPIGPIAAAPSSWKTITTANSGTPGVRCRPCKA